MRKVEVLLTPSPNKTPTRKSFMSRSNLNAIARGRLNGKWKSDTATLHRMNAAVRAGFSVQEVADKFGYSASCVYRLTQATRVRQYYSTFKKFQFPALRISA